MGIVRFISFVKKTYPDSVTIELPIGSKGTKIKRPSKKRDNNSSTASNNGEIKAMYVTMILTEQSYVEGLYVDLNSPVHMIAMRTFKYGISWRAKTEDDMILQNYFRSIPEAQRLSILFDNLGLYLIYCFLTVKPVNVFMIAADGVAPKAKMVQQRMRRFRPTGSPLDFFDPVVISPGTPFMDALDEYLTKTWPQKYNKFFPPGLNIIYSGHREAGEGEHKMFDQMTKDMSGSSRARTVYGKGKGKAYQVVLGADADLVVLSLAKAENIIFMRHQDFFQDNDQFKSNNNSNSVDDTNISVSGKYRKKGEVEKQLNKQNAAAVEKPEPLETAVHASLVKQQNMTEQEIEALKDQAWKNVFQNSFEYIDCTYIRKRLLKDYLAPNDVTDFSLISFFVGNDFLPAIPELEATVAFEPQYFTEAEIEARYYNMIEPTKDGIDRFWLGFEQLEQTWVANSSGNNNQSGKYDFRRMQGLDNTELDQFEAFPLEEHPISLELPRRRMLIVKEKPAVVTNELEGLNNSSGSGNNGTGGVRTRVPQWHIPKKDTGSITRSLQIYKQLIVNLGKQNRGVGNTSKFAGREGGNSFLVERKNRINYANLYLFFVELYGYSDIFMKSEAANYKELSRRQQQSRDEKAKTKEERIKSGKLVANENGEYVDEDEDAIPDPLIIDSIGKQTKGGEGGVFVPTAFSALHTINSFGIYDTQYADPKLPKKSIDEMCRCWLEGAQWILLYYSEGIKAVNTQWFYPYRYAPNIIDMMRYLNSRIVSEVQLGSIGRILPNIGQSRNHILGPDVEVIKLNDGLGINYTLHIYADENARRVALLENAFTGASKFIDYNSLWLLKKRTMTINEEERDTAEELGKVPMIEVSKEIVTLGLKLTFPLEQTIFDLVADASDGYATTVESFFSIMPEHVLRTIIFPNAPAIVDFVLFGTNADNQKLSIGDAFPLQFEMMTEGQFYAHQATPKISFVSPTRLERIMSELENVIATDSNAELYTSIIARYNVRKVRQIVSHKGLTHTSVANYKPLILSSNSSNANKPIKTVTGLVKQPEALMVKGLTIEEQAIKYFADAPSTPYQQFQPLIWENISNAVLYAKTSKIAILDEKKYENIHIGQRKLLITELDFLTKFGHLGTEIVYAGAAPGQHISILIELFPNHTFHLWDPLPISIKSSPKVIIRNKRFDAEASKMYGGGVFQTKGVLFISDIRTSPPESGTNKTSQSSVVEYGKLTAEQQAKFEEGVDLDNRNQAGWVLDMNPIASLLTFRIPFNYDKPAYLYIQGNIVVQAWAAPSSAETRYISNREQITTSKNGAGIFINVSEYENKMYFYNTFIRPLGKYQLPISEESQKKIPYAKNNYDTVYEMYTWVQYIQSRPNFNQRYQLNSDGTPATAEAMVQKVEEALVNSMNEVSRALGRDLNNDDISQGKSFKARPKFTLK